MKSSDLVKIVNRAIDRYGIKKVDIAKGAGVAPSEITSYTTGRKRDFNAATFFKVLFAMPARARIFVVSSIVLDSLKTTDGEGMGFNPSDLDPYISLRRGAIAKVVGRAIDNYKLDASDVARSASIDPTEFGEFLDNKRDLLSESFFRVLCSLPYEAIARIVFTLLIEVFRAREERAIARDDGDILDEFASL